MKLGHIHIKVRNLDRSVKFYSELFDLKITEKLEPYFAFLTGNEMHHTMALQVRGENAPGPDPRAVGLFHIAFEADNKNEFAEKYLQLTNQGIRPHLVDHRISWAMYFNDPDGNGLEIYTDTREEEDKTQTWEGDDRQLTEEKVLAALKPQDS